MAENQPPQGPLVPDGGMPLWKKILYVIWGVSTDPRIVGPVRAILLYGIPLAVEWYGGWVAGLHISDPRLLGLMGLTVALMRGVGEVILDHIKNLKLGVNNVPTPPRQ